MKHATAAFVTLLLLPAAALAAALAAADTAALEKDVWAVETAFAQTMADRDHAAFATFLDPEVVFFNGEQRQVGAEAVATAWAGFFQGENALFSWGPEAVAVLESGTLGLSSGPVFNPAGERIGTYNSVWRRNADGEWKIIFDRGCPACE